MSPSRTDGRSSTDRSDATTRHPAWGHPSLVGGAESDHPTDAAESIRETKNMSREKLEREMSLNLDGRLPCARRDQLLARIADDEEAARLWAEMQEAQELALSLPAETVGDAFADSLWERIRSGEGTPEAVFHEPVSPWTKARYVLTGAAAAAAILVGVQWFLGDPWSLGNEEQATPSTENLVASTDDASTAEQLSTRDPEDAPATANPRRGRLTPRDPAAPPRQVLVQQPVPGQLVPFDPLNVARGSTLACYDNVQRLQRQIPQIEQSLDADRPAELVSRVEPHLRRIRGAADVLRWLEQDQLITLDGHFLAELEGLMRAIKRFEDAADQDRPQPLWVAIDAVKSVDVTRFREGFTYRCCADPDEFVRSFQQLAEVNPHAGEALNVLTVEPPVSCEPEPQAWSNAPRIQLFIQIDGNSLGWTTR